MSYDWRQFLDLAQHLFHLSDGSVDEETRFRNAISRAYYAVFGVARQVLHGKTVDGVPFRFMFDAGDHALLRKSLAGLPAPQSKHSARVERLRLRRNSADYDDSYCEPNIHSSAQSSLALAVVLLDWLDSLP